MKLKHFIWLIVVIAGCREAQEFENEKIPLAGIWGFRIDSLDAGIAEKWYDAEFPDSLRLPGSMAENGKGNEIKVNTDWTGQVVDRSYFTGGKYERYRQPGNIKIPFWLKPVKYYKGPAWYRKKIEIPPAWSQKRIIFSMERCHWESTVFVNGRKAGSRNSLSVRHEYDITGMVNPGENVLTVRIDNSVIIPVGINSHSISDHTQSNWNGITGDISISAVSQVSIGRVVIFPDIEGKKAEISALVSNYSAKPFSGKLIVFSETADSERNKKLGRKEIPVSVPGESEKIDFSYPMGKDPGLWSEFNPVIYRLTAILEDESGRVIDTRSEDFGMRKFSVSGTKFTVNGTPVFLRGTTECCIFPLTGYPPADVPSWEKVLLTCREYGLNHVRFHSYCPPEAAFIAADRLGIYFHIECGSWANQGSTIGDGGPLDKFIYDESDRILEEYGNHPSFCMLAYGNEPAGKNVNEYLGNLVRYWKSKDKGRVYTSAAGWPALPESDYHLIPAPRIQQWGEELESVINGRPPQTRFDFRDIIAKYNVPVVGHETGQWCAYPDFREIEKYTGVLKATNFEIFRETLRDKNMGEQADKFLSSSGKLQVLCYKADIEAALRTPGFAGFEILQLHDFPGQGTALVGVLNAFFESKGYVTPEEFRTFCNQTVPLARMDKMVYSNRESFSADLEIAHFGPVPVRNAEVLSRILAEDGSVIISDSSVISEIPVGNCIPAGTFSFALRNITSPRKLIFEVSLKNTDFRNSWDFWVYPGDKQEDPGDIYVTDKADNKVLGKLKNGGSVLLLAYGRIGKNKGAQVGIGFSSIFWNTAWTRNQAPHTLGFVCDPEHPLFENFPTEFHSNWQWWDPVTHSQAMIVDDLPGIKPVVQPIDTWFENRKLALIFEARSEGGKILVCSIDMGDLNGRIVSQQLYNSMLKYMKGKNFNPGAEIELEKIRYLTE